MATPTADSLEEALAGIESRERKARRRVVVYTALPVAIAGVLVWYASHRIQSLVAEASSLQDEINDYRMQIDSLKLQLSVAEQQLQDATNLNQYRHPIDYPDIKANFSRYPREARALELIFDLRERGVSWRLGGQSPDRGFDSPSFAAYVLGELKLSGGDVRPGETLLATSRRLFDRLPPIPQPRIGDLVFYPSGYVMFRFEDRRRQPFVIGMSPFGITALKPDFAEAIGYRRIDYGGQ